VFNNADDQATEPASLLIQRALEKLGNCGKFAAAAPEAGEAKALSNAGEGKRLINERMWLPG